MPLRPRYQILVALVLLAGTFVFYACRSPEAEPTRSIPGGQPELGAELMRTHGCINCHTVPGIQGANGMVGPPLTSFARRKLIAGNVANNREHLLTWIQDPQEIEPGTAMPTLGLNEAEARHIAAYLYTLE